LISPLGPGFFRLWPHPKQDNFRTSFDLIENLTRDRNAAQREASRFVTTKLRSRRKPAKSRRSKEALINPLSNLKFPAVVAAFALGIIAVASCTSGPKIASESLKGPRVSIMTYNVENLYDTDHDEGTEDFTFLPLAKKNDPKIKAGCELNSSDYRKNECYETDWNEALLKKKLSRLGQVIKQVGDGKGPDILTIAEIENQHVLDMFRDQEFKDSGYVTAKVIDSFDPRGIDPGVLSRFPMWREPKIHRIPLKALDKSGEYSAARTRGILEVPVTLPDGTKAIVYAVHFPSQQNPAYLRTQAAEFLNKLVSELPPDVLAIAGGDFNVTREEDEKLGEFKTILGGMWHVAHLEGCQSCEGTHYYHPKTEWSFLDSILVRRASESTTGWKLDASSVRVPNDTRFQISKYGSPARFDGKSPYGVSDHWPVYAEIVKVAPAAAPTTAAPPVAAPPTAPVASPTPAASPVPKAG
jgi:endonuclease/exonuclease/phosphatase family metal-dependent hydrolase